MATLFDKLNRPFKVGGDAINAATEKTTPVDADMIGLMDSAASNVLKKLSWANTKATLKTYFDTLYRGAIGTNDFRLTLTSGVPVTTADVTGATTIYCTPYKGNQISLYDGAAWNTRSSAEFSLALGTLTSGKPYDIFCYDNAGVPTLEFLAWTNDTTRATALVYQNGILVKSGAPTRRYLGSFYTTSTTQTADSNEFRYLYNHYNNVPGMAFNSDTTSLNSYTYTTNTLRLANNSSKNQVNILIGVSESPIIVHATCHMYNSSEAVTITFGIGVDSTSALYQSVAGYHYYGTLGASGWTTADAHLNAILPEGKHIIAALEASQAAGTSTWDASYGRFIRALIRR